MDTCYFDKAEFYIVKKLSDGSVSVINIPRPISYSYDYQYFNDPILYTDFEWNTWAFKTSVVTDIKHGDLIAVAYDNYGETIIRFGKIINNEYKYHVLSDATCDRYIKMRLAPLNHICSDTINAVKNTYISSKRMDQNNMAITPYNTMYNDNSELASKIALRIDRAFYAINSVGKLVKISNGVAMNTDALMMPTIEKVIINNPSVIIFWSDGDKTISKVMDGEKFDPQIGFAMAISKKYYACQGYPYPRAAFKNAISKYAVDFSQKTLDKKAKKKSKEKHDD